MIRMSTFRLHQNSNLRQCLLVRIVARTFICASVEIGEGGIVVAGSVGTPPMSVVEGRFVKVLKFRNIELYNKLKWRENITMILFCSNSNYEIDYISV